MALIGEVAARGVFVLLAPHVVAQHAAARIDRVRARVHLAASQAGWRRRRRCVGGGIDERAERRCLDDVLAELHVHDLEPPADNPRAAEQLLHLVGSGVGGDVEVFRRHAQQQVAYCAAHDERAMAALLQAVGDANRVLRYQRRVDAMHVRRQDHRHVRVALRAAGAAFFARALADGFYIVRERGGVVGSAVSRSAFLAEQLANEFFNHVVEKSSRMRQPRACACARKVSSGLVAIGSVTFSSRGMSLCESL